LQKILMALTNLLFSAWVIVTFVSNVEAQETCSRSAIINYQEILIDTNSTQKGEGLRFYLEKDPTAIKYLDKYQEGAQIKWANIVMGTTGSLLTIGGLLVGGDSDDKKAMIIGGVSLLIVNYLTAQTSYFGNERNLEKAIREYNYRNSPPIYYSPENTKKFKESPTQSRDWPLLYLNIARSF